MRLLLRASCCIITLIVIWLAWLLASGLRYEACIRYARAHLEAARKVATLWPNAEQGISYWSGTKGGPQTWHIRVEISASCVMEIRVPIETSITGLSCREVGPPVCALVQYSSETDESGRLLIRGKNRVEFELSMLDEIARRGPNAALGITWCHGITSDESRSAEDAVRGAP